VERRRPPRTIRILAFDDNDELDVIAPYEMLDTARKILQGQNLPAPDVRIVSVKGTTEKPDVVRGFHGLTFGTQPWTEGERPDLLIVAGGGYKQNPKGTPAIGISKQMNNPDFTAVILTQHEEGRALASVCTGAFGLVGAGIVQGRRMTTHPVALDDLAKAGAHVLNPDWEARVVDDGDIISCGGVTSGTDEALYLVEAFWPDKPSLIGSLRGYVDYYFRATVALA
jgi:transcriptional regulator GlxA family with amidase domain